MVQPRRLQRCPLHVVSCPSTQAVAAPKLAYRYSTHRARGAPARARAESALLGAVLQRYGRWRGIQAMKLEAYQKIESLRAEYRWEGAGPHLR